jgi:Transposase domain (DUF772)
MLCWISILGGLLIMMGHHDRSEALFYYFRLEDQVPENHLLRLIDKHISFAFVRKKLKESYSETGRPSIDPELLLRILLIGYLYGITSERKLVEELRMHLAWRWFTHVRCCLVRYGEDFRKGYAWARPALLRHNSKLKGDKIGFDHLQTAVNVQHWTPYYRMASHAVHPNATFIRSHLGSRVDVPVS